MALKILSSDGEKSKALSQLYSKSLTLGYNERVTEQLLTFVMSVRSDSIDCIRRLVRSCRAHEQRQVLSSVLVFIGQRLLRDGPAVSFDSPEPGTSPRIQGAVAMMRSLIGENEALKDHLVACFTGKSNSSAIGSSEVRRVTLAALADDEDRLETVMEHSFQQFGDQLFLKHTPMLQQEA
ncbi:hypothetical protein LTS18_002211, partial [Coniosporium uncinatum]